MKILFITNAGGLDYLPDSIFHGLVSLGHEVTDSKYMWYHSPVTQEQKSRLYGKGFTISGLLPDRSTIDRSNIQERIKAREFDLIIYGSIHRCSDYLNIVLNSYPREKIIILDGQDQPQHSRTEIIDALLPKTLYFRRELKDNRAFPISFSIPEQKLVKEFFPKERLQATIIPGNKSTYIYTKEEDYYKGYSTSYFGLTRKKNGWDCMRHYQIIACGCLPYFMDFHNCPKYTMVNWPVSLQREANRMYQTKDLRDYDKLLHEFFSYCKQNLTTKSAARYVLSKAG